MRPQARIAYLDHWKDNEVQLCTLLSIKTGGCSEDCAYCAQSARYHSGVRAERLMNPDDVLAVARRARENGSTRFCMGAAWKGVREGDAKFEQVLEIVRGVSRLGMEVCVTLGQLSLGEARKLKEAGVPAAEIGALLDSGATVDGGPIAEADAAALEPVAGKNSMP